MTDPKTRADWDALANRLAIRGQAFVDGRYVDAASGETFDCLSPIDGRLLARVAECGSVDIDRAVAAARRSFDAGKWSNVRPVQRKKVILRFAQLLQQPAQASTLAAAGRPVVFDVPLLTPGSAWRRRVARVLVVDCDPETQVQRVMARNGWTREAVEAVMRQQAARVQRLGAADAALFNGAGNTLLQLEDDVRAMATSFGL